MIISVQPLSNILHFEQTWSKERTGQTWEQGSKKKTFVDGSSVLCPERENVAKFPRSSLEFETLIKSLFPLYGLGETPPAEKGELPYPMVETPELAQTTVWKLGVPEKNQAVTALCWTGLDDHPLWDPIGQDASSPSLSLLPTKLINTLARLLATASMPPFWFPLLLRCVLWLLR